VFSNTHPRAIRCSVHYWRNKKKNFNPNFKL
jgi:hypothetical protein